MAKPYKGFRPPFIEEQAPKGSYRELFKWGSPTGYKVPREGLYNYMKETFGLTDDDFQKPFETGYDKVEFDAPISLTEDQIAKLESIVGKSYVKRDSYTRLMVSYGKTMYDVLRLRKHIVENIPDVVVQPESKEQIEKIVAFVAEEKIPLYVFGGGSSVTRGFECMKGGISLDLRERFNKVIKFNEINQTITVEAGMSGPDLENHLRNAVQEFGAKRAYTCGHFPQSFEYSSVGGWVVTRGAGQNSTYFGKIEHIVLGQEYATPIGVIKTDDYAAKATGPDINQIMMGGEGAFGVLTHVTLRVFRYMPKNQFRFSYMFHNWEDAQNAAREIMQSQFGYPSVFRISDPEETEVMMQQYAIQDMPLIPQILEKKGFRRNEKCLMLAWTDGERKFCKNQMKQAKKICKKYKAMSLTGIPVNEWEKGRFTNPYLRDNLQDFGIVIETMECAVNWDNMQQVYNSVKKYCHERPKTVIMTHISHAYPQGANLYFIFIAHMTEMEDFLSYHRGILSAIQKSGAAMSHHHGIGKMFAPWIEGQLGTNQLNIFKALKNHFDPDNLMNPGGTLGLDLKEEDKVFKRPKW